MNEKPIKPTRFGADNISIGRSAPMRSCPFVSNYIPYGRQWIDDDDVQAVSEVLGSDFLTTGPVVEQFESALASHVRAQHAVVLNSGTSALHAAYFAAGLNPEHEMITTPLTFAATANAARYLGARVRFVDIEPDTGNIDPKQLQDAISSKTRLIVPVDYAGHPAEYSAITAVAERHGVTVVADAAHSLGATYHGRPVGTLADMTAISLHPVKPMTTAEGGAVFTANAAWADTMRSFRSHGIQRDTNEAEPWYYEMHDLGYNYRLTDVQSALGLSQLNKLGSFIARRRAIAQQYDEILQHVDGLQLPTVRSHVGSAWHLYVVRVPESKYRTRFFQRLRELGVGVQVHYIPVYWHPFYQRLGYRRGLCPQAEDFYNRAVSLPIFPKMSDGDVEKVIERVYEAAKEVWG